jgi:hypothetical protein
VIYYWILKGERARETGEDWMRGLSECDRGAMLLLLLRLNQARMANCLNANDARVIERPSLQSTARTSAKLLLLRGLNLTRTAIYFKRYDGGERGQRLMRRERELG